MEAKDVLELIHQTDEVLDEITKLHAKSRRHSYKNPEVDDALSQIQHAGVNIYKAAVKLNGVYFEMSG